MLHMADLTRKELHDTLKSLTRKRQRLWQMLYQTRGSFTLFITRGGIATRLGGDDIGYNTLCSYLVGLNVVIEQLTDCIVTGQPVDFDLSYWL